MHANEREWNSCEWEAGGRKSMMRNLARLFISVHSRLFADPLPALRTPAEDFRRPVVGILLAIDVA